MSTGQAKPPKVWTRDERRQVKTLAVTVQSYIRALDALMAKPYSATRDGEVAKLTNILEMANDHVRFFVLGEDYRKAKP